MISQAAEPQRMIRRADPTGDAAACAAIYAPYVSHSVISFEEEPPTAAEFAARMAGVSARYPWLVAEEAGEVIAYAYACEHRERAAYRWATEVSVYVAPDRRRRGAGRALYEALLDRLTRQGFQVALAGITLPNPASVGLHEALGFQPAGTFRRIGWKAGAWHDVGWWQLDLVAPGGGEPRGPDPPD